MHGQHIAIAIATYIHDVDDFVQLGIDVTLDL